MLLLWSNDFNEAARRLAFQEREYALSVHDAIHYLMKASGHWQDWYMKGDYSARGTTARERMDAALGDARARLARSHFDSAVTTLIPGEFLFRAARVIDDRMVEIAREADGAQAQAPNIQSP